jgi:hypothetical protein
MLNTKIGAGDGIQLEDPKKYPQQILLLFNYKQLAPLFILYISTDLLSKIWSNLCRFMEQISTAKNERSAEKK